MKKIIFIAKLFLLSLFLSVNAFGQDLTISPQNTADVDWTFSLFSYPLRPTWDHIVEPTKDGNDRYIRTSRMLSIPTVSLNGRRYDPINPGISGYNASDQFIGCYEGEDIKWMARIGGANLQTRVIDVATTKSGYTICAVELYSQEQSSDNPLGGYAISNMDLCINRNITWPGTGCNVNIPVTGMLQNEQTSSPTYRAYLLIKFDSNGNSSTYKIFPVGAEITRLDADDEGNIYFSGQQAWSTTVREANYDGNKIEPFNSNPIFGPKDSDAIVGKLNSATNKVEWIESFSNKVGYSPIEHGGVDIGDIVCYEDDIYFLGTYPLLSIQPNPKLFFSGANSSTVHSLFNTFPTENKAGYSLFKMNKNNGIIEWIREANAKGLDVSYTNAIEHSILSITNSQIYLGVSFGSYNLGYNSILADELSFSPSSLNYLGNTFKLESDNITSQQELGILSYNLDGDLLWGVTPTNENNSKLNGITSDEKGNVYVGFTYKDNGKLGGLDIQNSTSSPMGAIAKFDKCGNPFWIKNIGAYASDIAYISDEKIYVANKGLDFLTTRPQDVGRSQILALKNTPETSCQGLLLTGNPAGTGWQWYKDDCTTPIAGATNSTYFATVEGNYHSTAIVGGILQSSNAVWVNMTPEYADFEIEGETRVCLNTYQYSISNIQSDVTYEWKLDGVVVQTGSAPFSKTWTATDAGIRTISITAETQGGCIFTKELKVKVFDPAPPLNMSPDVTICEGHQGNILLSARTDGYVSYSWSPITAGNPSIFINPNTLTTGTTTYTVTATMANGCTNTGTISITKDSGGNLNLPTSICVNSSIPLPTGYSYSGQGVSGSVTTGFIFDASGLQSGFTYEITYSSNSGCGGERKAEIEVKDSHKDYNLQIMACAGSNQAEVFLTPSLSNGDELELLGQTYTSGGYWNISSSIGTSVTATITNNTTASACGGTYINNSLNTVTVTVVEAPAKDLYYKDHPFDFGQQPSGGGWNSPSITVTQVAPPVGADNVISLDPSNIFLDPAIHQNSFIRFYYSDSNNPTDFATVEAITDAHEGLLVGGALNYLYLKIHNKCGSFGKGLEFDASFARATTTFNPGGWTSFLPAGLEPYIPRDLGDGGTLIIAIPIDGNTVGLGNYHTCTFAEIKNCSDDGVTCDSETPGFNYRPSAGISGSNNLTWRNINVISNLQGESAVTIKNDDLVGKMVRVKYDFDPHTPSKAHYLEYNSLQISLPSGLLSRWSANNYLSNNVDFINGSSSLVRLTEQRNGWMEFWLDAGESYTLGLSFGIPPSNNLSLQDPVYRFHVLQFNEGVQSGGVSYNLMIDFVDVAPVIPSNLQAQAISSSKIELTWLDNSDNEQVFVLERRILGSSTYEIVANINENETTYTDEGLDSYTTYQYRLKAMSSTGLVSDYIYAEATTHISSDIQISGTIRNHVDNAPVGEVVVELLDANNNVISQITTISDGVYSFNVLPNTIYKVRPSKDINPHNGVDNADLQAIGGGGASAGGTITFNNTPYLFLAADVNGDCRVNLGDRMMLRNFVLGNISSITAPSWKFVSSDYDLSLIYTNYSNNLPCFENTRVYNSITASYINQDFVGVKTGDITGDVDPLQKVQTKEVVKESTFKASPNPFTTSTIIHFSSEVEENYTMVVRNSLGQEIKRIEGVTKKGNNKVEINMLGYSSGLYYVEYISSDRRENIKIVLAR
ncbi:fibronectin type III domain-containing protein [Bernardetia sp. Wsw4-3y2]|uniref:T9SS type A sorting domain-containing protein n=1 Tax=Bernardetia sp. Wsw4-3y2 TaxID=3127471 RepID=UPI0030CAEB6C